MSLSDREKNFERQYAYDQEKLFKIEARACKLLGLWAAEQMSISGEEADTYAKTVVASNMDEPGLDDVKAKVLGDLKAKGLDITQHMLDAVIEKKLALAEQQVSGE